MGNGKMVSILKNSNRRNRRRKGNVVDKKFRELVLKVTEEEEKRVEENPRLEEMPVPDEMFENILMELHNRGQLREEDLPMLEQIKDNKKRKNSVVSELPEEDREALLLGRLLQEKGASSGEVLELLERKSKIYKGFGKCIKGVGIVAAMFICVVGITLSMEAGREYVKGLLGESVDEGLYIRNWNNSNMVMDYLSEESKAYDEIFEKLGVYPRRFYYNSAGLKFEFHHIWEGIDTAILSYFRNDGSYLEISISKLEEQDVDTMLIEGNVVESLKLDFSDISVDIYELITANDLDTDIITAFFWYDGIGYVINTNIDKAELITILEY